MQRPCYPNNQAVDNLSPRTKLKIRAAGLDIRQLMNE